MEVTLHRISDINISRHQYDSFNTVVVTVTDRDGTETEVRLFSDDNTPIKIGEDK